MAKVLYVKANPKNNEESRTFRISEHFINEYKKAHPEDEIIELDLYKENIHFLSKEEINTIMSKDKSNLRIIQFSNTHTSLQKQTNTS